MQTFVTCYLRDERDLMRAFRAQIPVRYTSEMETTFHIHIKPTNFRKSIFLTILPSKGKSGVVCTAANKG